uniref:Uncharacterized protein n=1 Tax=Caenorhabditis japonica TaxID=281687 RepID=A0A8R1INF9_CAEJA
MRGPPIVKTWLLNRACLECRCTRGERRRDAEGYLGLRALRQPGRLSPRQTVRTPTGYGVLAHNMDTFTQNVTLTNQQKSSPTLIPISQ